MVQYHSDEYNELIARIRTTPNGTARDALMHEAEKMILMNLLLCRCTFTNTTICDKRNNSKLFLDHIGTC